MILRCSYFFQNLGLDVLINKVLIQSNACIALQPKVSVSPSAHLSASLVMLSLNQEKIPAHKCKRAQIAYSMRLSIHPSFGPSICLSFRPSCLLFLSQSIRQAGRF